MRIALVHRDVHATTRGGIGTVYHQVGRRLVEAGHQVVYLTQHSKDPLRVTGGDTVMVERTEDMIRHRDAVASALHRIRPDIVECSSWEAEALNYLLSPNRCPVLVRGDLSARTMTTAEELIAAERAILNHADQVIAVSEFAARDLETSYGISMPEVVLNGVDHHRFRPDLGTGPGSPPTGNFVTLDPDGRPRSAAGNRGRLWPDDERKQLIWVGKITPMKGWDRLIDLSHELAEVAAIVVVLGHSPAFCDVGDTTHLRLVQDLSDNELADAYRAADWYLSTARWEGFGLAIAEAIACGTPALLPKHLGTSPELLAAGGGELYTTPNDICKLLATPAPSPGLPEAFSWETNTTRSIAIYQELTS